MQSLLRSSPLLIVSDYDGTLAHFTAIPTEAYPQPKAWKAFIQLSHLTGVQIALLTGRDRSSILNLTNFPFPDSVVGGHGAELPGKAIRLSTAELELYNTIAAELKQLVQSATSAFIEEKPLSLVLHTRQCSAEIEDALIATATQLAESFPQIHFTLGKKVAEFSIRTCNKGDGLAWLVNNTHAKAAVFVGDDITDEGGFRWLRQNMPKNSYSLRVGPGETQANDRVDTIDDIADFFLAIYQIRSAMTHNKCC